MRGYLFYKDKTLIELRKFLTNVDSIFGKFRPQAMDFIKYAKNELDTELDTIKAYDVWKEKKNYGKVSMGVVRTTYLIDEKGTVIKAMGNVKAADNPQQMLNLL